MLGLAGLVPEFGAYFFVLLSAYFLYYLNKETSLIENEQEMGLTKTYDQARSS